MKTKFKTGFTLIELVVVLAVLVLLGIVFSPTLARTSPNTKSVQCLNNHRQLCNAWRMYAADSGDAIVYASNDGTGTSNPLNQYAWVQDHQDFNPSNPGNWDPSYLKRSPLWPYCGENTAIWKCPADQSFLLVSGVPKPRIRSFSMNLYLGGFAGTDGGWPFARPFRIFLKAAELSALAPSSAFVFLDFRPDFVNWGNFLTDMTGYLPTAPSLYQLTDLPAYSHNGACGFSFADAHGEMKRWRDGRTMPPLYSNVPSPYRCPNNPDVAWLQDHATRPK
ncbi:MAG TPA: prepilin-type N-terminal cleavage/methylation domain-containing protein [Verrucomicrobiae bacterium]